MSIDAQTFRTLFPDIAGHSDQDSLDALMNSMTTQTVSAGDVVVREGDETDKLYLVVEGKLNSTLHGRDSEVDMGTVSAGHTFCRMNLIDPGPASMTITAEEDATLLVLSHDAFRQLENDHLHMTGNILRMLSDEMVAFCQNADRMLFNRSAGITDKTVPHEHAGLREWATKALKKLSS